MLAALLFFATLKFADSNAILSQIALDKAGFSCNMIDGVWGEKSQRAFANYLTSRNINSDDLSAENAYKHLHKLVENPYVYVTIDESDIEKLVEIPLDVSERAKLKTLGYTNLTEMLSERGHLTKRALERLNPSVDFSNLSPLTRVRIPDFETIDKLLSIGRKNQRAGYSVAEEVKISISKREISVFGANKKMIACFPCSIAKRKEKLPEPGEFFITTTIANPNYTLTSSEKNKKYILPPGPNCPVGIVWIGLNLDRYGIHGTASPETVGTAESKGCFRLSNWNAARLFSLVKNGTRVIIEP